MTVPISRLKDDSAKKPRTVAVVLAGGVGTRMGLEIPKQFLPIAGKSSLEHTVAIFNANDAIDDILVMITPEHLGAAQEILGRKFPKVLAIIPGGVTRSETSQRALTHIEHPDSKILFHDAVRPLLDPLIINRCLEALDTFNAVDTAVPATDTIIEVDAENRLTAIPPRHKLRQGQTPQGFRKHTISLAYERAAQDPDFTATDDCSVVLKYCPDTPITAVEGSPENIKITHPSDIHLADKLFQLRRRQIYAQSVDSSTFSDTDIVILGGSYGIGGELAQQLKTLGARVHSFSRSETGTDISRREDIQQALAIADKTSGKIDHIILAAGKLTVSPLTEIPPAELEESVTTNLMSAYWVAQEGFPYLQSSQGSLLWYTSSSYTRGRANYSVYSSTKAALVNLTQALAEEWQGSGVRVNCINPTRTATPMRRKAFGEEEAQTLLDSAEVAHASLRVLANKDSGFIYEVRLPETDPAPVLPRNEAVL